MQNSQIINLGLTDYEKALDYQCQLFKLRHLDKINDTLVLTEHYPIYTCGRSADPYLLKGKIKKNIEIVEVDRDGGFAFYGKGQLIVYPIISLQKMNIFTYLRKLEYMVIRTLAIYGIKACANKNTGVWVGNKKIASIGIKVANRITMHGLSLNVNCNLDYFKPILACGLKVKPVSIQAILGYRVDMEDIADLIILNFGKIFNTRIRLGVKDEEGKSGVIAKSDNKTNQITAKSTQNNKKI